MGDVQRFLLPFFGPFRVRAGFGVLPPIAANSAPLARMAVSLPLSCAIFAKSGRFDAGKTANTRQVLTLQPHSNRLCSGHLPYLAHTLLGFTNGCLHPTKGRRCRSNESRHPATAAAAAEAASFHPRARRRPRRVRASFFKRSRNSSI